MYSSGVLALLGWAVTATAQGRLGIGDQAACTPKYTSFQYVGCYGDALNGGKAGFPFRVESAQADPKAYPNFSTASLTVDVCNTACRAHGYHYSLLYAAVECWCSMQLPYPEPPASGDTTNNGIYRGDSPGTQSPASSCSARCPGNDSQICGGQSHGSVYADQSFVSDSSPPTVGVSANYKYYGCYTNSNGGPGFVSIHSSSLAGCQNYCGGLGYAFAVRSNIDRDASYNCQCGPEIQAGLQVDESGCSAYCNGTFGATGGQGTCGGTGGQYSVYKNPRLQGCYIPREPGVDATHTYVAPANAGGAPSSGSTASASGSSTSSAVSSSPSSSFAYRGCYSEGTSGRALSDASTVSNTMTVEKCAAFCQAYTYMGIEYSSECYCGNTIGTGAAPITDGSCSMTCGGDQTEICGGPSRLSFYQRSASSPGSSSASGISTRTSSTSSASSSSTSSIISVPASVSIYVGVGTTVVSVTTQTTTVITTQTERSTVTSISNREVTTTYTTAQTITQTVRDLQLTLMGY
ncbi:hypothetical protein XANCAGTX0491_001951 [Xanthoria calcicola]